MFEPIGVEERPMRLRDKWAWLAMWSEANANPSTLLRLTPKEMTECAEKAYHFADEMMAAEKK
jgi:hypothetical protein